MKSYQELLTYVMQLGEEHADRTGVGTRSVFGYQWRHRMSHGFPLLTTKKLPFRWVAEELFWFLSGSTNEQDLRQRGVDIWQEWSTPEQCARFGREAGDLGPVYGEMWRSFPVGARHPMSSRSPAERSEFDCVDQIADLLYDLKHSPNSRRMIVSGWHPYWQRKVALPPCHTLFQLKVHPKVTRRVFKQSHFDEVTGEGLSLHLYARSIDSFLGLPFNIASYALLLSLLAEVTNRVPHDLIISFGDLHIYTNHLEQVKEQLSREPRPLPHLVIDESLRGGGLEALSQATMADLTLYHYNPHPAIKADVAV
jgi:thymidylate synthase